MWRAHSIRALVSVLLASFTLSVQVSSSTSSPPPIHVSLRAPWPGTPLLLELLEAAHTQDASSFWPLLTHLTSPWALVDAPPLTPEAAPRHKASDPGAALEAASARELYEAARRTLDAQHLLTQPGARDTWELALALHSEAPKVAAAWQMYERGDAQRRWVAAAREGCESWVDWAGKVLCNEKELRDALLDESVEMESTAAPLLVEMDHVFVPPTAAGVAASSNASLPTAILYGDVFSANFWILHTTLFEHVLGSRSSSDEAALRYVLRWKPPRKHRPRANLAGYGAALDLKKVDYLVIDDRRLKGGEYQVVQDEQARQMGEDRKWLDGLIGTKKKDQKESLSALTEQEVSKLDLLATQVIVKSSDPLRALLQLTREFPAHAVGLARRVSKIDKKLMKELQKLHSTAMEPGAEDIWVNGRQLTNKELSPVGILPVLRAEHALVSSLTALNMSAAAAVDLLGNAKLGAAQTMDASTAPVFDASDRAEAGKAITWWNDLESDKAYERWPRDLQGLLRPLYPGQFPMIRRNLFNLVMIMDLERKETCGFLAESIFPAMSRIGLHFGLVPVGASEESRQLRRMFWHIFEELGSTQAAMWLRFLAREESESALVNLTLAEHEYRVLLPASQGSYNDEAAAEREAAVSHYAARLRFEQPGRGQVLINGQALPFNNQLFQMVHQLISAQMQTLAPLVYYGKLSEEADLTHYFYDLPTSFAARSQLVFPDADAEQEGATSAPRAVNLVEVLATLQEERAVVEHFIYPTSDARVNATLWVLADLESPAGVNLFSQALKALHSAPLRVSFVHTGSEVGVRSTLLYKLLSSKQAERMTMFDLVDVVEPTSKVSEAARERAKVFWKSTQPLVQAFGVQQHALVLNGRVLTAFDPASVTADDLVTLFKSERGRRIDPVVEALSAVGVELSALDRDEHARIAMLASSLLSLVYYSDPAKENVFSDPIQPRSLALDFVKADVASFEIGDRENARVRLGVVLDPLSHAAQQWAPLIKMISSMPNTYVRVLLNPRPQLSEVPLRRFYRYSAPSKLSFDAQGAEVQTTLSFHSMPEDAVLTMSLDTPPSWLPMAEEAVHDLDNIRLSGAQGAVHAVYGLKHILIEGHALETGSRGAIPRGLELIVETPDGQVQLDTIVMANMAYLQFRAQPGFYKLRIREGRSADLYELEGTSDTLVLDALDGLTIFPKVKKREGMERESLIVELEADGSTKKKEEEGEKNEGLLAAAKNVLGMAAEQLRPARAVSKRSSADINIFTVASGHLYERMVYIMCLSVIKHTKSSVKFWFIENFLSPSFKEFIPHLAKAYGFEYELISYAWPHWLRAQTEKQRIIWGNKILFLDVLFPLDLSKVIFVDADQIVRADLKELIDTDLKGAPYGYPPMGNDSYDMDNFRFWEQGYWKGFLRGRPYHISALYVVDLNRFRRVAAGDQLRGQYQQLSADPGSLANLDQDLPNNLQFQLPIFTLDKTWLWCETWCSRDWLPQAKTIDLCQNPKVKSTKLERARQIPEWTEYDEEVAALAQRLADGEVIGRNVVAPAEVVVEEKEMEKVEKQKDHHAAQHDEL